MVIEFKSKMMSGLQIGTSHPPVLMESYSIVGDDWWQQGVDTFQQARNAIHF